MPYFLSCIDSSALSSPPGAKTVLLGLVWVFCARRVGAVRWEVQGSNPTRQPGAPSSFASEPPPPVTEAALWALCLLRARPANGLKLPPCSCGQRAGVGSGAELAQLKMAGSILTA